MDFKRGKYRDCVDRRRSFVGLKFMVISIGRRVYFAEPNKRSVKQKFFDFVFWFFFLPFAGR